MIETVDDIEINTDLQAAANVVQNDQHRKFNCPG